MVGPPSTPYALETNGDNAVEMTTHCPDVSPDSVPLVNSVPMMNRGVDDVHHSKDSSLGADVGVDDSGNHEEGRDLDQEEEGEIAE